MSDQVAGGKAGSVGPPDRGGEGVQQVGDHLEIPPARRGRGRVVCAGSEEV